MYDTSHDLSPATRQSIIDILSEHLADGIDLRLPTPARCNVQGCSVLGIFRQPARVRSASARTSG